ncbi:hypothetical protein [Streptomyces sp. NPDC002530]
MSIRSFIARPVNGTGYSGIHVQLDGQPSHHLPLLLTAYQYRWGRSVEAMTRHLVDDVTVGWDELGTDLLDGAPPALVSSLVGDERWSSRTLDHLVTPDGSPPVRMSVTDATVEDQDMQWGYVLHGSGIEVISLMNEDLGPMVRWSTDPRSAFSDDPAAWSSLAAAPVRAPRTAPAPHAPTAIPPNPASARTVPHR